MRGSDWLMFPLIIINFYTTAPWARVSQRLLVYNDFTIIYFEHVLAISFPGLLTLVYCELHFCVHYNDLANYSGL